MSEILHDVRFGLRILSKKPGMAIMAVLALSLGIGLTTAVFTVVHSVMFAQPEVAEPETLVSFETNMEGEESLLFVKSEDIQNWERADSPFASIGGFGMGTVNLSARNNPARYSGAFVTPNFMEMLRIQPVIGRDLSPLDNKPDAPAVALISHKVWQEQFEGATNILDIPVQINGESGKIVGVMPEEFHYPVREDVWVPFRKGGITSGRYLMVLGRLKPGISLSKAQQVAPAFASEAIGMSAAGEQANVDPPSISLARHDLMAMSMDRKEGRPWLWMLLGFAFLVLVIACANVANLLLALAAAREKEMAVRAAVGASRSRLIQQLITESLTLSVAGALGGLIVAAWLVDELWEATRVLELPYYITFDLSPIVFVFAGFVSVFAAVLAGLFPAHQATKINLSERLKEGSPTLSTRRTRIFSRNLAVVQIALASILLVGAGISLRSLYKIYSSPLGYNPSEILTMRMALFDAQYPDDASRLEFLGILQERLEEIPNITAAGFTNWMSEFGNYPARVQIDEPRTAEQATPECRWEVVGGSFFEALGQRIVAGRSFSAPDHASQVEEAVVNQRFAQRFWPDEDAIGKRFRLLNAKPDPAGKQGSWLTVVGVVSDFNTSGVVRKEGDLLNVYRPYHQEPQAFATLVVRSDSSKAPAGTDLCLFTSALAPQITQQIQKLDPHLPVYWTRTMLDFLSLQSIFYQLTAVIFILFSATAVFLAAIGVYGVMSFSVSQRRREIGIRLALGARPRSVLSMVLGQGLGQLILGLALGLAAAHLIGRTVDDYLYRVTPADPPSLLSAIVIISAVAVVACLLPARKATRLTPLEALRYE